MNSEQIAARNAQIVECYSKDDNTTMALLAKEFGVSTGTVCVAVCAAAANRSRRGRGRGKWTPEEKRQHSERMAKWWAEHPTGAGRPRIFPDDPVKREDYFRLARAMGAKYARRAMGVR